MAVIVWGANGHAQLGLGFSSDEVCKPHEVTFIESVNINGITQICGGGAHTVIVADGHLYASGRNCHGQLGFGYKGKDVDRFTKVTTLKDAAVFVCCGWDHTLVITDKGELFSCGSNTHGQLGLGEDMKFCAIPRKVALPSVIKVAAGLRHSLALTEDGSVYSWGCGKKGQLGIESERRNSNLPNLVKGLVSMKITDIVCGSFHSAALTDCGILYVWGCNDRGQLGHDPKQISVNFTPIIMSPQHFQNRKITKIYSGWTHFIAVTDSGHIYSWGRNDLHQLGRETKASLDWSPNCISNLKNPKTMCVGSEYCLLVSEESSQTLAWGWNEHRMLCIEDEEIIKLPTIVKALEDKLIVLLGCGAGQVLAVEKKKKKKD